MDRKVFGYRIEQLRRSNNMSMHDVARLSHCSPSLVYRTEQGLRIPKPKTLVKLAQGLGISKYKMFAMAGLNQSYDVVYQQISDLAKQLGHDDLQDLKEYTLSLCRKSRPAKQTGYSHELTPIRL